MARLSSLNPMLDFVQGGVDQGARFQNGQRTLLCAAPPRLEHVGGAAILGASVGRSAVADAIAFPLGMVQDVSISSGLQVQRIFEMGSKRSYFVPGHAVPGLSFSRPHIHGPSLLRVCYAYYSDVLPPTIIPAVFPNVGQGTVPFPMNVVDSPGYGNVFLNLSSELFQNPVGFLLMQDDSRGENMFLAFLECAYVGNHSWSSNAQGSVISEQVSVQFERIVHVATPGVALYNGM